VDKAIGYKEWEVVCDALGTGDQVILLRKGGIHEGRDGFSFKHERFFLFPTRFHAQGEQVRVPCEVTGEEWQPGDVVSVRYFCEAVWAKTLMDWDEVLRLQEDHIWNGELVRERFAWGEEGEQGSIHCAMVRVARLAEPWEITYEKKHGGCRTWVELPDTPGDIIASARPVLDDAEFARRQVRVENG
jgi:hypothetical protein